MQEQPATTSAGRTLRPKKPNMKYSDGSDEMDVEGKPAVLVGESPAQAAPKPSLPKKKRQFLTDQLWSDNPEERGRERNRIHARKSRQRKKVYIDGLKAENTARTAELELLISTWEQACQAPDASFLRTVPDSLDPAMCAQLNALSDSDGEDGSPSRKDSHSGYDEEGGGGEEGAGEEGGTMEARQARSRERNRIHARKSRMRKKLFTEQCAKIHGAIMKDIDRCRKDIVAALGEDAPVLAEASAKYVSVLEEQLAYWQQVSMGMAEDNEKRQDKLAAAALVPDAVGPRAKRGRPSLYDGSGGPGGEEDEEEGSGGWEEEEEEEEDGAEGEEGTMSRAGEGERATKGAGAGGSDPLAMLVDVEARTVTRGKHGVGRGVRVSAGEEQEGQAAGDGQRADTDGEQLYTSAAGSSYRLSSSRGGRGGAAAGAGGRKRGRTTFLEEREGEAEGGRGDASRSSSGRSRSSSGMEGYSEEEEYEDGEEDEDGALDEHGGRRGKRVSSSGRRIRPVRQADDGYDVDAEQPLGRRKRKQHPVGYPGRGRPRKTYPGGGHGPYMGGGERGRDGAGSVEGSSGGGSHGSGSGSTPSWSHTGSSGRAPGPDSDLPTASPTLTGVTGGSGGEQAETESTGVGLGLGHGHGAPSVRSASTAYGSSDDGRSSTHSGPSSSPPGPAPVVILSLPALAKAAASHCPLAHRLYMQAMELLRHGKGSSEVGRAVVPPVTTTTSSSSTPPGEGGEGGEHPRGPLLVIPSRLPPHPAAYVKLAVSSEGEAGSLSLTYDSSSYSAAVAAYSSYYSGTLLPALQVAHGKGGVRGAGQPLVYTTEYYKEAEAAVQAAMDKAAVQPSSSHAALFAELPLVHSHPLQALQLTWEQACSGKSEGQEALAKCIVQLSS